MTAQEEDALSDDPDRALTHFFLSKILSPKAVYSSCWVNAATDFIAVSSS